MVIFFWDGNEVSVKWENLKRGDESWVELNAEAKRESDATRTRWGKHVPVTVGVVHAQAR